MTNFTHPCQALTIAATTTPQKTFIYYKRNDGEIGQIKYKDFLEESKKCGQWLSKNEVKRGEKVSVLLPDGPDYLYVMFGCWWIGAIYMPLPINATLEAVRNLDEANVNHVVKTKADEEKLIVIGKDIKKIEFSEFSNFKQQAELQPIEFTEEMPAYIFCSSGSSGTPKVIQCDFSGVTGRILKAGEITGCDNETSVLAFFDRSFDANLFDIFMTVYHNASLLMVTKDERGNILKLKNYLEQFKNYIKPNFAVLLPTTLNTLDPTDFNDLTTVMTTGEACSKTKLKKWFVSNEKRRIFNGYGPTEATIAATISEVKIKQDIEPENDKCPISGPLDGIELYIQKRDDHETVDIVKNRPFIKINTPTSDIKGELIISGSGIGKYLHNNTEHQNRFFSYNENKSYRTGDRVSIVNGELYFEGRYDRQLKRDGKLTNLDDIEAKIEKMASFISFVITINCQRNTGTDAILAFIHFNEAVTENLKQRYQAELKKHDKRNWPDFTYIINNPESFSKQNKPKTRKIDVLTKTDPILLRHANILEPKTHDGKKLREIWYELVKPESCASAFKMDASVISMGESLTNIGGTSLTKPNFINKICKEFNITNAAYIERFNKLAKDDNPLSKFEDLLVTILKYSEFQLNSVIDININNHVCVADLNLPVNEWLQLYIDNERTNNRDNQYIQISATDILKSPDFIKQLENSTSTQIHIHIEDVDAIPAYSFPDLTKQMSGKKSNIHFYYWVPDLLWAKNYLQLQNISLHNFTHRTDYQHQSITTKEELANYFERTLTRYGFHFHENLPHFSQFVEFLKKLGEVLKKNTQLQLDKLPLPWDRFASKDDELAHLLHAPLFLLARPLLNIKADGSITVTDKFTQLLNLLVNDTHAIPSIANSENTDQELEQHAIEAGIADEYKDRVRCLRLGKSKAAIFLFHPLTGDVPDRYEEMIADLPNDYTVYAIFNPKSNTTRYSTQQEQVTDYANLVMAIQPEKRVFIGWSYGATLAYLVTAALEEQDKKKNKMVELIVAIEPAVAKQKLPAEELKKVLYHMLHHFVTATFKLKEEFTEKQFDEITKPTQNEVNSVEDYFDKVQEYFNKENNDTSSLELFNQLIGNARDNFSLQYNNPAPINKINAPMVIIHATESINGLESNTNSTYWAAITDNLTQRNFTGNHFSIMGKTLYKKITQEMITAISGSNIKAKIEAIRGLPSKTTEYIELSFGKNGNAINELERLLTKDKRIIVINGESGSGKSTLLAEFQQRIKSKDYYVIPLLKLTNDAITATLRASHLTDKEIKKLKKYKNKSKKIIFIIDALDEKGLLENADTLLKIKEWPDAYFIFAWRSNTKKPYWINDENLETLNIAPLTIQQINQYLQNKLAHLPTLIDNLKAKQHWLASLKRPYMLQLFYEYVLADQLKFTTENLVIENDHLTQTSVEPTKDIENYLFNHFHEIFKPMKSVVFTDIEVKWLSNIVRGLYDPNYHYDPSQNQDSFTSLHLYKHLLNNHFQNITQSFQQTHGIPVGLSQQTMIEKMWNYNMRFAISLMDNSNQDEYNQEDTITWLLRKSCLFTTGRGYHQSIIEYLAATAIFAALEAAAQGDYTKLTWLSNADFTNNKWQEVLAFLTDMINIKLNLNPNNTLELIKQIPKMQINSSDNPIASLLLNIVRKSIPDYSKYKANAKIILARTVVNRILGPVRDGAISYRSNLYQQAEEKSWKGIPKDLIDLLKNKVNVTLTNIRFAENIDTKHGFDITLGDEIYFNRALNLSNPKDVYALLYQVAHVQHYQEQGGFEPFILDYFVDIVFAVEPYLKDIKENIFNLMFNESYLNSIINDIHDKISFEQSAKENALKYFQVIYPHVTLVSNSNKGDLTARFFEKIKKEIKKHIKKEINNYFNSLKIELTSHRESPSPQTNQQDERVLLRAPTPHKNLASEESHQLISAKEESQTNEPRSTGTNRKLFSYANLNGNLALINTGLAIVKDIFKDKRKIDFNSIFNEVSKLNQKLDDYQVKLKSILRKLEENKLSSTVISLQERIYYYSTVIADARKDLADLIAKRSIAMEEWTELKQHIETFVETLTELQHDCLSNKSRAEITQYNFFQPYKVQPVSTRFICLDEVLENLPDNSNPQIGYR